MLCFGAEAHYSLRHKVKGSVFSTYMCKPQHIQVIRKLWIAIEVTCAVVFQVEDLTIALDSQRANVSNMEKKQRKFDQILADAKAESER